MCGAGEGAGECVEQGEGAGECVEQGRVRVSVWFKSRGWGAVWDGGVRYVYVAAHHKNPGTYLPQV